MIIKMSFMSFFFFFFVFFFLILQIFTLFITDIFYFHWLLSAEDDFH